MIHYTRVDASKELDRKAEQKEDNKMFSAKDVVKKFKKMLSHLTRQEDQKNQAKVFSTYLKEEGIKVISFSSYFVIARTSS